MMTFETLDPAGPEAHLWAFQSYEPKNFLSAEPVWIRVLASATQRDTTTAFGLGLGLYKDLMTIHQHHHHHPRFEPATLPRLHPTLPHSSPTCSSALQIRR